MTTDIFKSIKRNKNAIVIWRTSEDKPILSIMFDNSKFKNKTYRVIYTNKLVKDNVHGLVDDFKKKLQKLFGEINVKPGYLLDANNYGDQDFYDGVFIKESPDFVDLEEKARFDSLTKEQQEAEIAFNKDLDKLYEQATKENWNDDQIYEANKVLFKKYQNMESA